MEKHIHKWVKLYYRKYIKMNHASWITLKDTYICQDCLELRTLTKFNDKVKREDTQ